VDPAPIAERARGVLATNGYGDVRVRVADDGPCAKSVEPRGRVVEVTTATRHEDDTARIEDRTFDALAGLFERASLECIEPERFGALARNVLDRAGLGQVRVGVSQRFFPCASSSSGFSPERLRVEIGASDRKTWRLNHASFLRYQRQTGSAR
jgi:hypothetical protein